MIDKSTARELAKKEISKLTSNMRHKYELAIQDDITIERKFGWIFFYNTKSFLETQDTQYALIGNAPIIVDRENASVHFTGTAKSIDEYIEEFQENRKIK